MSKKWLISGVALGIVIGLVISVRFNLAPLSTAENGPDRDVSLGMIDVNETQNAFINVASKVGPAVVAISTERIHVVQGVPGRSFRPSPFGGGQGDPFEQFFREFFGGVPEREFKQRGLGSGFVFDKRGYILTNFHVIENADKITVTLPDGRSFEGNVSGTDPRSDLAVIKINARDLPVARLGNSDTVKTGQWVVALGNPFGHVLRSPEPTVTVGVVSALHRHIPSGRDMGFHFDMIQTDAAINPGNSGGPLCNINGEVIGINLAIFSTSGGYQGVGFAIPSNRARDVIDTLIQGRNVSYGWLGVFAQEINDELAEYFNLSDKEGVLVSKVIEGSPAHKGGIMEGDIIKEFGSVKIKNFYDLGRTVAKTDVGKTVDVKIIRDRVGKTLKVTIERRPGEDEEIEVAERPSDSVSKAWRGIKVGNITEDIAMQLGIRDKTGVVVLEIDMSSQFAVMGMRRGDVIREINKNIIKNIDDFNRIIKEARGNVLIRTDRGYFIVKE